MSSGRSSERDCVEVEGVWFDGGIVGDGCMCSNFNGVEVDEILCHNEL